MSWSSMRGYEEKVAKGTEEDGDIDLTLSLSLNGRFGINPQINRRVTEASDVSITPKKRSSAMFNEYGSELKTRPSIPTGTEVKEMGMGRKEQALLNVNKRRSLDSQGSSTISPFQGQGFPANNGSSSNKDQGKFVETVAENISSKAITDDRVIGRVFDNVAEMPRVFITVHGRKTEGFLAKYGQEEVDIICACHGYFMTPAEFIKHAGGGDVFNPEKHITIIHPQGGDHGVNPLN